MGREDAWCSQNHPGEDRPSGHQTTCFQLSPCAQGVPCLLKHLWFWRSALPLPSSVRRAPLIFAPCFLVSDICLATFSTVLQVCKLDLGLFFVRNSTRCNQRLSNRNSPKLNTVGSSGIFASPVENYGVIGPGTCPLTEGLGSCCSGILLSMAMCADGESPWRDDVSSMNELLCEKRLPTVSVGSWVGEGSHSLFSTQQFNPGKGNKRNPKKLTVLFKHEKWRNSSFCFDC